MLYILQGTNQQQDTRFSDKEKKLLKQMKFGDCLNQRVIYCIFEYRMVTLNRFFSFHWFLSRVG